MISIIIPTYNEISYGFLPKILERLQCLEDLEIICVDNYSHDGTVELIESSSAKRVMIETNSRASRLNAGVRKAKHDMILLHHPRSLIDLSGIESLIEKRAELQWGGFTHCFDIHHPLLRFTSWYSNQIRATRSGILYLDHCIFCQKKLLEKVGLVPELDIFEDTALSMLLREQCKPILLSEKSITSSIRFQKNGIFRQAFSNQILKLGYHLGISHQKMNRFYEKKTRLNANYD